MNIESFIADHSQLIKTLLILSGFLPIIGFAYYCLAYGDDFFGRPDKKKSTKNLS
jgi:hypothetical protein